MMTVLYRYLVSMVVAALWTVAEELVSSFVNYGPITNSTYGVIAPMFVVLMPVLANAFSVPFARDFIHLGRMRLPTLRDFFVFLRVSILAYILFFASNFCFRSMNDNPFPSLRWFLWLLILVCFSVLAFGASGLAFLCSFRDRSALRCFSRALTIYKNNFLKTTGISISVLVFLVLLFYFIKSLNQGRWFDFANNVYLTAFGVCWVIANDVIRKMGKELRGL